MNQTEFLSSVRRLAITGLAAAVILTGGCRDESAQPQPETGEGQVDLDLAEPPPQEASSPEGFDPGEAPAVGAGEREGQAEEPAAPPPTPPPAPPAEAGEEGEEGGVVNRQELESGLIIEDLVIGEGAEAPPGATVTIHYDGRLTDGTPFDSSYDRGEPATFPLGSLIQGWQQGIPGMREGGKRRLRIPYQLAYGEQGRPPRIPPRSDLVFVIELFEVH